LVAGTTVFPMLGREYVKAQQHGPVLGQALHGLAVFGAVGLDEEVEGGLGTDLGPPPIQMSWR
jgi:hypothetical protein